MDTIIGRIQTEADSQGRRVDIQFDTTIHAIKLDDDSSVAASLSEGWLGATFSTDTPSNSSLWFIPD